MRIFLLVILFFHVSSAIAQLGTGQMGSFDASDENDPVLSDRVWRAYSIVDPSPKWGPQNRVISTRVAFSDNKGSTFTDVQLLNLGADLLQENLSLANEVPTLVYDPSDSVPSARWKVIWDRHVINKGSRDITHSWFGIKGASIPIGPWSAEQRLLAGTKNLPDTDNPILFTSTDLSDCSVITEPAALTTTDGFYLAFHCQPLGPISTSRIALVKFVHPAGGGTTLQNIGSFFTSTDAQTIARNYSGKELAKTVAFSAPDLVVINQVIYLIVTPVDSSANYLGCIVFQVSDISKASIKRTFGNPSVIKYLAATNDTHRGACTYSKNNGNSGLVLSQLKLGLAKPFTLLDTLIQLP